MLTTSKSHFQGMEMGKSAVPSPTKPLIDIIVRSKNPARPGLHTIVLSMQEKTGGKDVVLVTCLQNAVGPTTETPGAISGHQGEMAGMWWPTKWTRQILNLGVAHAFTFIFFLENTHMSSPLFPSTNCVAAMHFAPCRHPTAAVNLSILSMFFFFLLPSSLSPQDYKHQSLPHTSSPQPRSCRSPALRLSLGFPKRDPRGMEAAGLDGSHGWQLLFRE